MNSSFLEFEAGGNQNLNTDPFRLPLPHAYFIDSSGHAPPKTAKLHGGDFQTSGSNVCCLYLSDSHVWSIWVRGWPSFVASLPYLHPPHLNHTEIYLRRSRDLPWLVVPWFGWAETGATDRHRIYPYISRSLRSCCSAAIKRV